MNPFKYSQVVTGSDFCPRKNLEKKIVENIKSGQNILVEGERRIGKTSLIINTVRNIKKRKLLYINSAEVKSPDDFCKRIVRSLFTMESQSGMLEKLMRVFSSLKPTISVDSLTGSPSVSLDPSLKLRPETLEEIFDVIEKEKKNTVIVFDEFQDILDLKEKNSVLAVMRGKIQFHNDIPYIFAGSIRKKIDSIFDDPDSPFYKSVVKIDVEKIDKIAFENFIRDKFATGKRNPSGELINEIFGITESITGDMQQLCRAIWNVTSEKDNIEKDIIPKVLEDIFSQEYKGYEDTIHNLTEQQIRCLKGIARSGGKNVFASDFLKITGIAQPGSVTKALNRMVQLKIIYDYRNEYKFFNPFFKMWLVKDCFI